jgi:hypothetical protein
MNLKYFFITTINNLISLYLNYHKMIKELNTEIIQSSLDFSAPSSEPFRKNSWFQQLINGEINHDSVYRPVVSLAVEALDGLVQCVPLTSSMTSLVS